MVEQVGGGSVINGATPFIFILRSIFVEFFEFTLANKNPLRVGAYIIRQILQPEV